MLEFLEGEIMATEIKKITTIEVCINSLSSFSSDERGLLFEYANLVSQDFQENKLILYVDSLSNILNMLEDEDEYKDVDYTGFKIRLNNLVNAGADQYIFD
jgi:hypothetical protein